MTTTDNNGQHTKDGQQLTGNDGRTTETRQRTDDDGRRRTDDDGLRSHFGSSRSSRSLCGRAQLEDGHGQHHGARHDDQHGALLAGGRSCLRPHAWAGIQVLHRLSSFCSGESLLGARRRGSASLTASSGRSPPHVAEPCTTLASRQRRCEAWRTPASLPGRRKQPRYATWSAISPSLTRFPHATEASRMTSREPLRKHLQLGASRTRRTMARWTATAHNRSPRGAERTTLRRQPTQCKADGAQTRGIARLGVWVHAQRCADRRPTASARCARPPLPRIMDRLAWLAGRRG